MANDKLDQLRVMRELKVVPTNKSPKDIGPVGKREHVSTATYQYRDPVQRRGYMANYMRTYRKTGRGR